MKPSIGRIVHHVGLAGRHCAAIVTEVQEDGSLGLCIFPPGSVPVTMHTGAWQDEETKAVGTWHFPERVD